MKRKSLLFMLLLALLAPWTAKAQTYTADQAGVIGTGTSAQSCAPIDLYYKSFLNQSIYTADEIGLEGKSATIKTISFQYDYTTSYTSNSFTVYLGNTTKSSFSSNTDWITTGNMSSVYTGTITTGSTNGAWVTITLSSTFSYTGGNLVVCLFDNNCDSYPGTSSSDWRYTTTSDYKFIYYRSDGTAPTISTSTSGTRSYNRPNIKLNIGGTSASITSATFYDSGGSSGAYAIYEDYIWTFYPSTTGGKVILDITSFASEGSWDYFRVYDGENTSATNMLNYSGSSPGTTHFVATNSAGAITVWWHSDSSNNYAGWAATLSVSGPPTVTTSNTYNNLTSTSVNLGGTINSMGGTSSVTAGICLSTTNPPTTSNTYLQSNYSSTGTYSKDFTGLTPGTTYYYRAYAYNSNNSFSNPTYGDTYYFTTPVEVAIGSTSSTNSTIPTYTFYNYSLTQQIYKASEIGYTGTINSISFYHSGSSSITRSLVIYMKNTTTSTLSAYDTSPGTTVFSGSVTFAANAWTTINLSSAFSYSNICNNLMVTVDDNTGSYEGSHPFAVYSTGENRAMYVYSDGTNYTPTSSNTLSTMQSNNSIKLNMTSATGYKILTASSNDLTMGSFSLNPSGTNCSSGNYYAYSTGTTVTLTASATSGNTFVNWTVDGTTVTANPTTITMNDHHTVVANFSENPASIPYTDGFESSAWKFVNGAQTNKWYRGAAGARNGSYGLFISNDGSNNTYDIGSNGAVWTYKTINFDETTNYAISFDWRAYAESCCDYIRVGLVPASTTLTDGSDFSTPSGWIDLNGSSGLNNQTAWQRKTVIQNVTAGNYKLAFCWRNDGSVGSDPPAAIDNIEVRKALTVAVSAGTGGSASGGGSFALNQRCTVTATPNSNYCFVNWTESGTEVSTSPTYTFDVTANRTLVANFASTSASSIAVSGNSTSCGNTATLTASGLTGVTYKWYSDASCTNLVATGATLTTPVLYDNTTYYVKAVRESVREQYSTFNYTGGSQSYTIPSGASALKMEVWGAQGGGRQVDGNSNGGYGGNGGYSVGTLENLSGVSSVYVYVGGQGQTSMRQTEVSAPGGWNGGGTAFASSQSDPACGGGGATDIRVNGTSLYYRIMVAGGGGGGGEDSEQGGYGGGTTGGTGSSSGTTGGTQTGGGTGYAFGIGASTQYDGGAGGGGWYGGGCGNGTQTIPTSNSTSDSQGGCGGSGYVWSSSTASSAPSGYAVSTAYYLTNAQTIAGNATMPNPAGGTMTGNQSNGYARITAIFNEVCETEAKAVTVTVNQPAAPTNVQVTNIGLITATASWSGSASSYKWRIDSGAWYTTSNTSVSLTGLTPGQTYTFRVKAVDGTCESDEATATFTTQNTHTVTVSANPNNGGTVSGGGTITHGTNCTVTATPATGWHFVSWTENGSVVSNANPYTFQVNADHNLVANFEQTDYTLTIYYKYRNESQAASTYTNNQLHYGESYSVNSPSIPGYTPTQATVSGNMPADNVTVTVYYDINTYTVTIVSNNNAYGTVDVGSILSVPYNTAISVSNNTLTINGTTVTATAETSDTQYTYAFSGWTSNGLSVPATVTDNITITANFTQTVNNYTLTFASNNSNYGSVSPTTVSVPYGTTIMESGATLTMNGTTVTATPAQSDAQYTYAFSSWSNVPSTVTGNVTVTANFTATTNTYTVTIVPNDGTWGTVSQGSASTSSSSSPRMSRSRA